MQLTEAETNVIKDLQTQEKTCVEKYRFYEASAHDRQLKDLFHRIGDEEQEHFESLGEVLKGSVPDVKAAQTGMEGYNPTVTYSAGDNSEEKKHDQFLCTDSDHQPLRIFFSIPCHIFRPCRIYYAYGGSL